MAQGKTTAEVLAESDEMIATFLDIYEQRAAEAERG